MKPIFEEKIDEEFHDSLYLNKTLRRVFFRSCLSDTESEIEEDIEDTQDTSFIQKHFGETCQNLNKTLRTSITGCCISDTESEIEDISIYQDTVFYDYNDSEIEDDEDVDYDDDDEDFSSEQSLLITPSIVLEKHI